MIRYTLPDGGSFHVDGIMWTEDEWGHRTPLEIRTEPAPLEDWVPACIGGLRFRDEPECLECIWRKACKCSG